MKIKIACKLDLIAGEGEIHLKLLTLFLLSII